MTEIINWSGDRIAKLVSINRKIEEKIMKSLKVMLQLLFPITLGMCFFIEEPAGVEEPAEPTAIKPQAIEDLVKKASEDRDTFWKKKLGLQNKQVEKLAEQVAKFKAGGEKAGELETEIDDYKGRIESSEGKILELSEENKRLKETTIENIILRSVSKVKRRLVKGADEDLILRMKMNCIEQNGEMIIKGSDGQRRYSGRQDTNGKFVPLTADEYAEEILEQKQNWLEPTSQGGGGDRGNPNSIKTVSAENYNRMSSAERAEYRSSLNDEQRESLLNN